MVGEGRGRGGVGGELSDGLLFFFVALLREESEERGAGVCVCVCVCVCVVCVEG